MPRGVNQDNIEILEARIMTLSSEQYVSTVLTNNGTDFDVNEYLCRCRLD